MIVCLSKYFGGGFDEEVASTKRVYFNIKSCILQIVDCESILLTCATDATNFKLVVGFYEADCFCLFFELELYRVTFFEWHDFAAMDARCMVVMCGECVAEFEFVFPANRQSLDNT